MFGYSHASDRKAYVNTGYTQKNGAVSKVNKEFISRLTWAQSTPSAVATVQVSHALPAVHFSSLLRGQFPRWRRSRKTLSVCSVLRCLDLWLQCTMHGASFINRARNSRCTVITDLDASKRNTQKAFSCCDAILETGPAVSMRSELLVAHEKLGQLPLLTVYVVLV